MVLSWENSRGKQLDRTSLPKSIVQSNILSLLSSFPCQFSQFFGHKNPTYAFFAYVQNTARTAYPMTSGAMSMARPFGGHQAMYLANYLLASPDCINKVLRDLHAVRRAPPPSYTPLLFSQLLVCYLYYTTKSPKFPS